MGGGPGLPLHPFIHIQRTGGGRASEVVRGEGAGLGLGPPSPEFFLNNTKEFRTPDHRPSWWDLGYKEVRPLNGLPFLCS